jgi:hypothetical protein
MTMLEKDLKDRVLAVLEVPGVLDVLSGLL